MFQGIKCVVQGADHIAKNLICQDAAEYKISERYGIAVVADGHGSAKYFRSDIGSKKAVQAAIETVDAYMADYERFAEKIRGNQQYVLRKMGEQFLARWTQAIEDYHDENPLTDEEREKMEKAKVGEDNIYTFYGSTVLIAVMAEDFYYGLLVGDGGFVLVKDNGEVLIPIEDKNSHANYTSSICSRNAIDALTCFFEDGKPLALCVSTDGLIKSFESEQDFLDYHILLTTMLSNLENCQVSLAKNLHKRTVSGSGDDISVSVIFQEQRVVEGQELLKGLIEEKRAKQRAREEELADIRRKAQEAQERQKQQKLRDSIQSLEQEKLRVKKLMEEKLLHLDSMMEAKEQEHRQLFEKQKKEQERASADEPFTKELLPRKFSEEVKAKDEDLSYQESGDELPREVVWKDDTQSDQASGDELCSDEELEEELRFPIDFEEDEE